MQVGEPNYDQYIIESNRLGLVDIDWSKRPSLLGIIDNSTILIFDLLIHTYKPVLTIQHDKKLKAISFNMFE